VIYKGTGSFKAQTTYTSGYTGRYHAMKSKDGVYRLGGTPTAVMQNKELMELMLPTLRADFTLYDTYTYVPDEPFACSMSAFYGEQDHLVSAFELVSWREQTRGPFTLTGIPGSHFFLHSAPELFLQALSRELRNVLNT